MARRALLLAALAAACGSPQPCPTPLAECSGQCVDLQSNRYACGACGRACAAGEVCFAGGCTPDVQTACPDRVGGAFVTFGACGSAVKLWVRRTDFVDEAATYVGTAALPRTPLLDVVAGTDCDGQWSWHADPLSPAWVTTVSVPCTAACPAAIEAAVGAGTLSPATWCPTPLSSLVLAVDRRSP